MRMTELAFGKLNPNALKIAADRLDESLLLQLISLNRRGRKKEFSHENTDPFAQEEFRHSLVPTLVQRSKFLHLDVHGDFHNLINTLIFRNVQAILVGHILT